MLLFLGFNTSARYATTIGKKKLSEKKKKKLSEFRRLGFNLFHSDTVDRKKRVFETKNGFDLKMGKLCTFLVAYRARPTGILNGKDIQDAGF